MLCASKLSVFSFYLLISLIILSNLSVTPIFQLSGSSVWKAYQTDLLFMTVFFCSFNLQCILSIELFISSLLFISSSLWFFFKSLCFHAFSLWFLYFILLL